MAVHSGRSSVFVGHSRIRTDHACRILGSNVCAAGLRRVLHCDLLIGEDGGQALLCNLELEGLKGDRDA
jgi:hypothetical protein